MKKIALLLFAVFMLQLHFTSATFAITSDRIKVGQELHEGGWLVSRNMEYKFQISLYGDLELWKRHPKPENLLWTKKSINKWGNYYLKIDYYSGKLVWMNGDTPNWYSDNAAWSNIHYQGKPPANLKGDILIMQDDGNLVLYNTTDLNQGWYPVWATDTGVGGP